MQQQKIISHTNSLNMPGTKNFLFSIKKNYECEIFRMSKSKYLVNVSRIFKIEIKHYKENVNETNTFC